MGLFELKLNLFKLFLNNINKIALSTAIALAEVLECDVTDLMEDE